MFNPIRRMPSFQSVAAGSTASIALPIGPTYQNLTLRYKESGVDAVEATLKSSLAKVRLKVNGTTRWEATGKHIIDCMNKFYGIGFVAGQLVIPLARPWMRTLQAEDNLAWGTQNLNTLGLEVDIAAGAVAPSMICDAMLDPNQRDLGTIIQVSEFSFASATAGDYEISTLPKGNGNLAALHFDNSNITAVKAVADGYILNDGDLVNSNHALQWISQRTPQAGYVHIDALVKNRIDDSWPLVGVQDFKITATMSAAGAVPLVMETINNPFAR